MDSTRNSPETKIRNARLSEEKYSLRWPFLTIAFICMLQGTNAVQIMNRQREDWNLLFGLGTTKTGTTSLHTALLKLGIKSTHKVSYSADIRRAGRESRPLLTYVPSHFEAFTGGTAHHEFVEALRDEFPRAIFVLTWRDMDDWLVSYNRHQFHQGRVKQGQLLNVQ